MKQYLPPLAHIAEMTKSRKCQTIIVSAIHTNVLIVARVMRLDLKMSKKRIFNSIKEYEAWAKPVDKMGFEPNKRLVMDYKNVRTTIEIGGKLCKFRSKLEAKVAQYLQLLKDSGHIKDWQFEQTTFHFPDDRYLVDFDIIDPDGSIWYLEAKGYVTAKTKRNLRLLHKYRPEVVIDMVFQNKSDIKKLGLAAKYCRRVCLLKELTRGII